MWLTPVRFQLGMPPAEILQVVAFASIGRGMLVGDVNTQSYSFATVRSFNCLRADTLNAFKKMFL